MHNSHNDNLSTIFQVEILAFSLSLPTVSLKESISSLIYSILMGQYITVIPLSIRTEKNNYFFFVSEN